ncbi:MAG: hypothetical protein FWB75_07310 [Oscillospiraceae bacterium]|nr:hypothetical protein [Oscillospiraceae bacterium]
MILSRRLVIAFLLLALLMIASCAQNTELEVPKLHAPITSTPDIAVATVGVIEELHILPGVTRLPTVAVRLESGQGVIGAFYAWPGDTVVPGQLVARLDSAPLEAALERLESSIDSMTASHNLQLREMTLRKQLMELNLTGLGGAGAAALRESISLLALDIDHLQRAHAFDLSQAQSEARELTEQINSAEIRSDVEGEIVYSAALGDWVNAHDPVVYVAVGTPGTDPAFVEYVGMMLNPRLMRAMRVQGLVGGELFEMEVAELEIEEHMYYTRREQPLPIRFNIISEQPQQAILPPGQAVSIRFYTAWNESALKIPSNALFEHGFGEYIVFRIQDGQQVLTYVTVGTITESYAEILEGLSEGDEIFVRP